MGSVTPALSPGPGWSYNSDVQYLNRQPRHIKLQEPNHVKARSVGGPARVERGSVRF